MKDDVKVMMPNITPMTLIPSNGVAIWDAVLKFGGRPESDHATHMKLDGKTYCTKFGL
jgi:hypothetical protein